MGNNNEPTEAEKLAAEKDKVITDLRGQIENLNKGIATYRDEVKTAKEEATAATTAAKETLTKLTEFEKLFAKKEKGVELSESEEKKFKAYAEKEGLVSKDDLQKHKNETFVETLKAVENQAVTEFLEKHPEYDDDGKWKEVLEQFGLYKQPSTLPAYRALLDKIYKELNPDEKKDAKAKAKAEIINRSKLSLGGGNGKTGDEDEDAELDRLAKKYPNLDRDTIAERLAETRALLKSKK